MNFDIGAIQATPSPLALLAGPQVVAPSDEFTVLMDLGAPPSKTNQPVENASTAQTLEASGVLKSPEIVAANLPDANPAIAQADALVLALSSGAKSPRMLDKSPEAFVSMKGENILPPAPIAASISNPFATPVAARKPDSAPTIVAFDEPSSPLPPMPPKALEDEAEDQSEADDQREETIEDESASRLVLAEPNAAILAAIQVSQTPTPFQEYDDVPGETTLETMTSPAPAKAKLEPAPTATSEGNEFAVGNQTSIKDFRSIAVSVEEQARETQPQSVLTTKPAAVASKPTDNQEPLSKGAPTIIGVSENPFARGAATKIASPRTAEAAETSTTIANIVQDPAAIPAIKSMSDRPAVAPPMSAIDNAPASTIDTILDRQLDLVRNERWLGELAQDIASTSDNKDQLSFRLMPRQLGRLDIDVSRSHSGISLTIRTESDSAQSILTAAQPRLADELRAQGVRLADTQMFSSDTRHSQHHGGAARPASLVENSITQTDAPDAPEQVQRDGRYA